MNTDRIYCREKDQIPLAAALKHGQRFLTESLRGHLALFLPLHLTVANFPRFLRVSLLSVLRDASALCCIIVSRSFIAKVLGGLPLLSQSHHKP